MKQSILMLGTDNFIVVVYVGERSRARKLGAPGQMKFLLQILTLTSKNLNFFVYCSLRTDLVRVFSIL